jgi:hypothetical protein
LIKKNFVGVILNSTTKKMDTINFDLINGEENVLKCHNCGGADFVAEFRPKTLGKPDTVLHKCANGCGDPMMIKPAKK